MIETCNRKFHDSRYDKKMNVVCCDDNSVIKI